MKEIFGKILESLTSFPKHPITALINLIKFIITAEKITPPGKINLSGSILVLVGLIIVVFNQFFILLYSIFLGKTDAVLSTPVIWAITYIFICAFILSIIEALVYYRDYKNDHN